MTKITEELEAQDKTTIMNMGADSRIIDEHLLYLNRNEMTWVQMLQKVVLRYHRENENLKNDLIQRIHERGY